MAGRYRSGAAEVVAFADAVHADGAGEQVILVAADAEAAAAAKRMAPFAEVIVEPFGDIWLRDTAPIMVSRTQARDFRFNGWGGKYDLPGDDDIACGSRGVAASTSRRATGCWKAARSTATGTGLVVTTEQCLLNPNRNPGLTRPVIVDFLQRDLGFSDVLWLENGLLNDHTDGHVDNLARFVAPGRLAIPEGSDNDPNWRVYQLAAEKAEAFGVEVVRVPSPGRIMHGDEIVPASYMNFYIGNATVVVPLYGAPNDDAAVGAFWALFPGRQVVGLRPTTS